MNIVAIEQSRALALRVEQALTRQANRWHDSLTWRSLVSEWRDCVHRHGAGSASARGVLLDIVREAWGDTAVRAACGADGWYIIGWPGRYTSAMSHLRGFRFETEALVAALETAP